MREVEAIVAASGLSGFRYIAFPPVVFRPLPPKPDVVEAPEVDAALPEPPAPELPAPESLAPEPAHVPVLATPQVAVALTVPAAIPLAAPPVPLQAAMPPPMRAPDPNPAPLPGFTPAPSPGSTPALSPVQQFPDAVPPLPVPAASELIAAVPAPSTRDEVQAASKLLADAEEAGSRPRRARRIARPAARIALAAARKD